MIHSAMDAQNRNPPRLCDYCDASVALLYCRADSAKLCLACDKEVHHTNQLFTKHSRSQLCDACDDAPASVFCETEHCVLCQNCDWERHNSSSGGGGGGGSSPIHSRRPVEGFTGCPSVTELVGIVGFDDLSDKNLFLSENSDGDRLPGSGSGGLSECLLWETPEIVSLNDLIGSGGSGHNFRAMDIPPLPKNRHATCGKHKTEMLRQLRDLAKSEPSCLKQEAVDAELDVGFQFLASEAEFLPENICTDFDPFTPWEVNGHKWSDLQDHEFPCVSVPRNISEEKPEDVFELNTVKWSGCPEETVMVPVNITKASQPYHEINSQERDSALSRYKEKKKTRRYEKHIRYESRKVRAESRTRIRGRFAKADP